MLIPCREGGGKTKNLSFNLLFPRVFVKIYQFVLKYTVQNGIKQVN